MRTVILFLFIFSSLAGAAQKERDTVLGRCPVYVTDTSTSNNFLLKRGLRP
ncbi:MAG: hypothetical protein IPP43_01540 [Chitinophagaceae bacterium]|nr:hypothetical protein [Chitinophagaceae bacterium]